MAKVGGACACANSSVGPIPAMALKGTGLSNVGSCRIACRGGGGTKATALGVVNSGRFCKAVALGFRVAPTTAPGPRATGAFQSTCGICAIGAAKASMTLGKPHSHGAIATGVPTAIGTGKGACGIATVTTGTFGGYGGLGRMAVSKGVADVNTKTFRKYVDLHAMGVNSQISTVNAGTFYSYGTLASIAVRAKHLASGDSNGCVFAETNRGGCGGLAMGIPTDELSSCGGLFRDRNLSARTEIVG